MTNEQRLINTLAMQRNQAMDALAMAMAERDALAAEVARLTPIEEEGNTASDRATERKAK